ncbi:MAG: FG-GAP-like repeat-containing protein, partial [Terracidiphilus sp.]
MIACKTQPLYCALLIASAFLLGRAFSLFAQTAPSPSLFSQAINHQPGNGLPSSVFLADVNGDGNLDVIVANQNGNNGDGSVSVFLGNGDGTLQAPVSYDSGGPGAVSVFAIDVNADGVLDLVVANQGPSNEDGSVGVLIGKGGGTFEPVATYDSGGPGATSVFVIDVNGDGLPDIVVTNQGTSTADGSVSVLLNGGSGAFSAAVTYDSGGVDPTSLALADVNGDGFPDIVVANYCYPLASCPQQQGGVAVLLNDMTGHFGAATSYQAAGPATSVAVGDVNGDGIPDIFVGVSTYGAGFLAGDGSGNFATYQPITGVQGQVVSVAVRDVNGDGINDLLIGLGYCAGCDIGLGSGVTVLLGTGTGSYGSPVVYTTGGELAGAIALGDLNGDTKLDMVVPNQCDDGIIDNSCGGNVAILLNSTSILTTTLVPSPNPALTGQTVTYTATVAQLGTPPAGTVTFRDGTTVIANDVPLTFDAGQYQATYNTSYSVAGTHQISATYSFAPISQISSILAETVLNPTSMTLVSSSPTSAPGQAVTFTAAITPTQGVIPDGELVTFSDAGTLIGTGTTTSGEAIFMTSTLATGSHTIAANYPGDTTFAASTASTKQLVQTIVTLPSPTIASVTPNHGSQGQQSLSVAISGSNFVEGATSAIFGGSDTGINVSTFTVNSPTTATAVLDIAPNTAPGSYNVVVTVTGAATSATLSGGFTVTLSTLQPEAVLIPGLIGTVAGEAQNPGRGADGVPATQSQLAYPTEAAVDGSGDLFITDSANLRVQRVDAVTGIVTTISQGNAGATDGVAVDASGNVYYSTYLGGQSSQVWLWNAASNTVSRYAGLYEGVGYSGDGGPATSAKLYRVIGMTVDAAGDLYMADLFNSVVRRVDAVTGIITTVAGDGTRGYAGDGRAATSSELSYPSGVAFDGEGNLYIADSGNNRIRRVAATTGIITTVVGTGTAGYSGDGGPATAAKLGASEGFAPPDSCCGVERRLDVASDSAGDLFLADAGNKVIRWVDAKTGIITTVAGNGSTY